VLGASTSPPKEQYAVSNDNVTRLIQTGEFADQLTEILRNGARALLAHAVEAEVAEFLGKHADLKAQSGHQRAVRHGHLPEREVMTGIGSVTVRQPRVCDREAVADDPDRIRFSPSVVPPYTLEVDRDAAADPLSEGDLDRRLLRGAGGTARQGEHTRLAEARSAGEALRLDLG
jgi:hypothetical protein